jgi:hypothetical protein
MKGKPAVGGDGLTGEGGAAAASAATADVGTGVADRERAHAALAVQRAEEMKGKPRLVIHQLVLENFKSYKGRRGRLDGRGRCGGGFSCDC